jgi:hypothetical protein
VDRDGEHFGHILGDMRDGVVSVAEPGAQPSMSLLRALKREFDLYCNELCAEQPMEPKQPDLALVMGGYCRGIDLASMERYNLLPGQWSAAAAVGTRRWFLGACAFAGELYITGGMSTSGPSSSVEKYTPSSDTWSAVAPLPSARCQHAVVAMSSAIYMLGGICGRADVASVLKYDSTQGNWSAVEPMPEPRRGHSACAIGSDIYVFGGQSLSTTQSPTHGARWSPCHFIAIIIVSVCLMAMWSILSELKEMATVSCASTRPLECGSHLALHRTRSFAVQPLCSADVSMWQAGVRVS